MLYCAFSYFTSSLLILLISYLDVLKLYIGMLRFAVKLGVEFCILLDDSGSRTTVRFVIRLLMLEAGRHNNHPLQVPHWANVIPS
jgi:hypothetical protein